MNKSTKTNELDEICPSSSYLVDRAISQTKAVIDPSDLRFLSETVLLSKSFLDYSRSRAFHLSWRRTPVSHPPCMRTLNSSRSEHERMCSLLALYLSPGLTRKNFRRSGQGSEAERGALTCADVDVAITHAVRGAKVTKRFLPSLSTCGAWIHIGVFSLEVSLSLILSTYRCCMRRYSPPSFSSTVLSELSSFYPPPRSGKKGKGTVLILNFRHNHQVSLPFMSWPRF